MPISFRKKSLEKLSSLDQLDILLKITSPNGWIALISIGVCLGFALAWGIWGRIPIQYSGQGLLLNPRGLFGVTAPGSGNIREVKVSLGQEIKKGDVLVVLDLPEDELRVKAAKHYLMLLKIDYERRKEDQERSLPLREMERSLQEKELKLDISTNQSMVKRLTRRIKSQEKLFKLGLIIQDDLFDTIDRRDEIRDKIALDQSQLISKQLSYELIKRDNANQLRQPEQKIERAKDSLAITQAVLTKNKLVTSPYDGIVAGMGMPRGAWVNTGEELVSLELIVAGDYDTSLKAVQYYPATIAQRIKKGMITQLAPGTVEVDRYGYLLARVVEVAPFPASSAQLHNRLQNDALVKFIQSGGLMVAVESELLNDPGTSSGYKWTSSKGPPYSLKTGTVCTTSVIVEQVPPLSLIIPMIKKYLLGIGEKQNG